MPWVRGHYRRSRTLKLSQLDKWIILYIVLVVSLIVIPPLRVLFGTLIGICALIWSVKYVRHKMRTLESEPYYIKSQCPLCHHQWNRVRYKKGQHPWGAKVECDHCGNSYRHRR